ncbi:hypothetical protein OG373_16015 [Streptomyces avidinii]|uniref:hypothetical protein n=1 Tax=Streptomyces avidinii TaxID=1895 RepID=UPI00386584DA|nr:hypothetical protein OG373_16015 [Streptomyces avidinii]
MRTALRTSIAAAFLAGALLAPVAGTAYAGAGLAAVVAGLGAVLLSRRARTRR